MPNRIVDDPKIVREKISAGVEKLSDIVATTLGPGGRNVGIDKGPEVDTMHDGVTVAKYVDDKDPAINWAIRILRQAANKQVEQVGDGTTVTTLLGDAIYTEAAKIVATGVNPMTLRKGIENAAFLVCDKLHEIATPVKTLDQKIQIATISAEDETLGKMIGEELDKLGLDGILTVEESKSTDTYLDHQDGTQFDKGWKSDRFVTNSDRMEATVEDTVVLLTDRQVVNFTELLGSPPLLDAAGNIMNPATGLFSIMGQKKLLTAVIIASDITDSALQICVNTKMAGQMNLLCIQAPYQGEMQKAFLDDLATLTNATVISQDSGKRLESLVFEDLGHAKRVTATKDATLVVGGSGDNKAISERIASIKALYERNEGSEYQQEKLRERIAKLQGGVSIIKVGGQTEGEMRERKERVIDAIASTRAAVEEGIVPGGEVAFLQAREVLQIGKHIFSKDSGLSKKDLKKLNDPGQDVLVAGEVESVHQMIPGEMTLGARILYEALEKPFDKLVENAGLDAGNARAMLSFESKTPNAGYDVTDGQIKDMIKAGIIDPVAVPVAAINNAVSVAIQLIITEKLIVPEPPPDDKK